MRDNMLKILSFEQKEVDRVLSNLGVSSDEDNRIIYNNTLQRCECCNKELTKHNFGSMLANSKHFFCDNPICIAKFVRETQFEKK